METVMNNYQIRSQSIRSPKNAVISHPMDRNILWVVDSNDDLVLNIPPAAKMFTCFWAAKYVMPMINIPAPSPEMCFPATKLKSIVMPAIKRAIPVNIITVHQLSSLTAFRKSNMIVKNKSFDEAKVIKRFIPASIFYDSRKSFDEHSLAGVDF